jgi:hypothetical protein
LGTRTGVYLLRPLDPEESKKVKEILDATAPGQPVEFINTGAFREKL